MSSNKSSIGDKGRTRSRKGDDAAPGMHPVGRKTVRFEIAPELPKNPPPGDGQEPGDRSPESSSSTRNASIAIIAVILIAAVVVIIVAHANRSASLSAVDSSRQGTPAAAETWSTPPSSPPPSPSDTPVPSPSPTSTPAASLAEPSPTAVATPQKLAVASTSEPSAPPATPEPTTTPAAEQTPTATPGTQVTAEQIASFIAENLRFSNERNIDALVASRAATVDYFGKGVVNQDYIRSDMSNYFQRWPIGSEVLVSPIRIERGRSANEVVALFKTHFRVQNAKGEFIEGDNDNTQTVDIEDAVLKISGEKAHVTNRQKGMVRPPVAVTSNVVRPQPATRYVATDAEWPGPPIDSIPILSPERAMTETVNPNLQVMEANFRSAYSGKTFRYSGSVVRKNSREQLLVFKGGGFLTTAYDVQVELNEDRKPGFADVNVGDRVTIVGTVDRVVVPLFGVGSNSIRINDARIYRLGR